MNINLVKKSDKPSGHRLFACFQKNDKEHGFSGASNFAKEAASLGFVKDFTAKAGESVSFNIEDTRYTLLGLGSKKKLNSESIRRNFSKTFKSLLKHKSIDIDLKSFSLGVNEEKALDILIEAIYLSSYTFSKYQAKAKSYKLKNVNFIVSKITPSSFKKIHESAKNTAQSVNFTRDLVNEVPNVLDSEHYAKIIEKDVKATFAGKGVKLNILTKAQIKKEKMNLFLSVNAGSAKEPRLVHLTYTPKKANKNTKHIALVGKGITFDTGGYSLKPSGSMVGMKFDMGGSATVYGAFRAAALAGSPYKITCILAMTDNAVNEHATMPDSVVIGRNGKSVEILNTDAEGRLILADALDYACDLKPDEIIDAATLTGACLVAFGQEVCAVLGNDDKFVNRLLKTAKNTDEYLWQLPIVDEYRGHLKSNIADIKNIGKGRMAGTAVAAAFLENFIKNDISWAHLDIAGVCDSQSHLPYCPSKGGSGIMVRTLANYLTSK